MTKVRYKDDLLRRLKDAKYAVGYLNACLEDPDEGAFMLAVRDVAQVHGGTAPPEQIRPTRIQHPSR